MGRRRRREGQFEQTLHSELMVWLKAEIEFGTTFSYRQPDVSAQFAVGSPLPSPSTIKLALVDAAIRWRGDVNYGRQVFDWVKTCSVKPVPPERVVRFRVFLKRLKPREQDLLESTGVRDYFLLDSPLTVFLQVPQSKVEEATDLLGKLRKLGTSDSLCWCACVRKSDQVPEELFPHLLDDIPTDNLKRVLTQGFTVVRMSDLAENATFEDFNPFGGQVRDASLQKRPYLLPLRLDRYGETWAILVRTPIRFTL